MKRFIKHILLFLPIIGDFLRFSKRYNEPRAISKVKFLIYNIIPVSLLHLFYKRESYLPIDRYSSDLRGNIFVGACTRIQRQGCYIQGRGKVFIGDYVEMASNITIVSGLHSLYNQDVGVYKETIIGDHCWIASNVVVNAGVVLGPRTIVGAGSVVTKSFPNGHCVIGGNPAKIIKELDSNMIVYPKDEFEFYGYLPSSRFKKYFERYYNDLKFEYNISLVSNNKFFQNY
mgnify:CR=1 FL=1|jgi:acetyltransferase-like isoleucine patch superfamily enzyme